MANLHSKISLLLLFSIFFVIINCESEKKPEDKLNVPQENKDFNSFAGKPYSYMEPNFFEKIGLHLAKGWHGFRGLFGRRANRRNENNYKNGAYEGKEEFQQPFEKESTTNKEYPEFGNNNFGNGNGNGYSGESQGQEQGQLFQGNQKGNREEVGFVDERIKENSEKGPKDDKKFGYEDLSGNPGKTAEIKNGENKKLDERKPSKPENDNYEAVFGKQNVPNGKQRKIRAAFRGPRLPIRGPFRQPFRQPFRGPFRGPFRRPGNRFRG